jgi:hypothetical protein
MKVEGIDFEAAKRRVAEILGRADLVREREKRFSSVEVSI